MEGIYITDGPDHRPLGGNVVWELRRGCPSWSATYYGFIVTHTSEGYTAYAFNCCTRLFILDLAKKLGLTNEQAQPITCKKGS